VRVAGARWDFAYDSASLCIYDVDGIGQFRGNIEQSVRPKVRAVRSNLFAEIDDGDRPPPEEVNNMNGASVRAGPPYPCASVDRNVPEVPVRGHRDLVSVNVNSHSGQNLFGHGVHKQRGVVHLVGNEKKIVCVEITRDGVRKQKVPEKGDNKEPVSQDRPFPSRTALESAGSIAA